MSDSSWTDESETHAVGLKQKEPRVETSSVSSDHAASDSSTFDDNSSESPPSHLIGGDYWNSESPRKKSGRNSTLYTLSWHNVSYHVYTRKGWWKAFFLKPLWRHLYNVALRRETDGAGALLSDLIRPFRRRRIDILNNMTGSITPGRIIAVMGPSGCGKTTLMDVLAGRISRANLLRQLLARMIAQPILLGKVRVNGQPRPAYFKRLSAYLMQDDALIGDLSVRENLFYSALLRLPLPMSPWEKIKRTKQVMADLGVFNVASSPVGSVYRRGVSGGQRRRVSIGMELITDPQVMFLDEPTSGLDSKSSYMIMQSLKRLCREQNKTIFCTIHQPSSQLFTLFDDVMFLTRGHVAYHGPIESFVPFMECAGFPVPAHTNPADHIMDIINYDFEDAEEDPQKLLEDIPLECNKMMAMPDDASEERAQYFQKLPKNMPDHVKSLLYSYQTSTVHANMHAQSSKAGKKLRSDEQPTIIEDWGGWAIRLAYEFLRNLTIGGDEHMKYATPFWFQTLVLMTRTFMLYLRNPGAFVVRFLMFGAMAFMMATFYWQIDDDQSSIIDRTSILFFAVAFLTFMAVVAIPALLNDRLVFLRERAAGAYRVGPWVLSHSIMSIPFLLLIAVWFTCLAYFAMGMRYEGWYVFLIGLWLALLVAESMVAIIASILPSYIIASTLTAGFFGMFMLASGFFVFVENIPVWWLWAHYLSFQKYTFEAYMKNEFEDSSFPCQPIPSTPSCSGSYYCIFPDSNGDGSLSGEEVLAHYGYEDVSIWTWYAILVMMFVGYRFIFYLVIRFLPKNKGNR